MFEVPQAAAAVALTSRPQASDSPFNSRRFPSPTSQTRLNSDSDPGYRRIFQDFRRLDLNGDGLISREELVIILKALGVPYDTAGLDMLVAALDANGDGLVDVDEFVSWVMCSRLRRRPSRRAHADDGRLFPLPSSSPGTPMPSCGDVLETPVSTHVFMTPEEEADMERITLFEIRAADNAALVQQAGLGRLDDPQLLVLSVGSSSTQAYDAAGFAASFPVGTQVVCTEALAHLAATLIERGFRGCHYRRVLLMNSIGYGLRPNDPVIVCLEELAARATAANSACQGDWALALASRLSLVLQEALPGVPLLVYNRAKDPRTKHYKYPQVSNDFAEALASGRGLRCLDACTPHAHDTIVDWGGASFKVYVDGHRIGTELMDANGHLCEGGVLHSHRHAAAVRQIEAFVAGIHPQARRILIAQTGKARELALRVAP